MNGTKSTMLALIVLVLSFSEGMSGQDSLSMLMDKYASAAREKNYERQHAIGNQLLEYIAQWMAKDIAGRRGDMAVILQYLSNPESAVRNTAAAFIGTTAQLNPGDVKPLIAGYEAQIIQAYKEHYGTDDVWERKFSDSLLRALIFAQPLSNETEAFVAGLVADPAVSSRHWGFAVFALAQSATTSAEARDVSTGILRSSNKEQLLTLLPMLAFLRNPDVAIVNQFKTLLRHDDPEVVTATLSAVPQWGAAAMPLLEEIELVINTPAVPAVVRAQARTAADRVRSHGFRAPE